MDFIGQFNTMLIEKLGPLGPIYVMGLAGALLVILGLIIVLNKKADPMDRLTGKVTQSARKADASDEPKLRYEDKAKKLDKYSTFLEPQDQESFSAMQLKLIQAGYRGQSTVRTYHFMQFALALGFMFLGIMYLLLTLEDATMQSTIMKVLIPAGVGYYLPSYWVERRRQTRMEALQDGFPDALDLMLVCVEAGQSLDQSIQRVSKEIRIGFPELAEEFEIVANEMKAGKERVNVLRDMGKRAGTQDISAFVTVLIQSASFGTSISDALRVYSSEMRDKRVMRAEEKANTLPTKLTLGTMMFTLPPLLIILIGPSIYDIYVLLLSQN